MIGAIVAGGAGRRMGEVANAGGKGAVTLVGRPLAAYPAAVLADICDRVAIVCKPYTKLPDLEGVERWYEPAEPRHPLTGIVHALERAGESVLVCAVDMPFVTADACRSLAGAAARAGDDPGVVVAVAAGVLQPVLGVYSPSALEPLRAAPPDAALAAVVEALSPVMVEVPPAVARSLNTMDDLAAAEAELRAAARVARA